MKNLKLIAVVLTIVVLVLQGFNEWNNNEAFRNGLLRLLESGESNDSKSNSPANAPKQEPNQTAPVKVTVHLQQKKTAPPATDEEFLPQQESYSQDGSGVVIQTQSIIPQTPSANWGHDTVDALPPTKVYVPLNVQQHK